MDMPSHQPIIGMAIWDEPKAMESLEAWSSLSPSFNPTATANEIESIARPTTRRKMAMESSMV